MMKKWLPILFSLNFCFYLAIVSAETRPVCPTNKPVESWTNCMGTYIDAIGGKYVGEWKNGKFHGIGTTTFNDKSHWAGDKYIGGWKDGKKYGQGTYTYADKSAKEGIWFNDKFLYPKKLILSKKTPKITPPKKLIVKENFTNLPECPTEQPTEAWNKCFGLHTEFNLEKVPPVVHLKARDYLINELETDPAATEQLMIDLMTGAIEPDETNAKVFDMLSGYGGTYTGTWKKGKFHGEGTTTFGSKTRWAKEKYTGDFIDGNRHGKGTYIYTNGSKYTGDFLKGKWNGFGTLVNSFGDKYVGEFKDGKRHGKGTLSNKKGETFIGEFINDIATNKGQLKKKTSKPN